MEAEARRCGLLGAPALVLMLVLGIATAAPMRAQEPPTGDPTPAAPAEPAPAAGPAAEAAAGTEAEPAPEPEAPAEPEAPPPPPEEPRRHPRDRPSHRSDAQVVVGSSLTIDADEVSDDVVVVGGNLLVEGEVLGDAVAIGGQVRIEGRVTGDVAAIGGNLLLGPEAEISGDAMSFGGNILQEEGSRIRGEVVEVSGAGLQLGDWSRLLSPWHGWRPMAWSFSPVGWFVSLAWSIFCLILLALFSCAALLLARTPVERIGRRVAAEPWKSGLVGLIAQLLFIPLLLMIIVLLCVSIIGIPFLFLLPFVILALFLVVFFGFVGVTLKLGEFLADRFGWRFRSDYAALLAGLAALTVWGLVGGMLDFDGPPMRLFAGLFTLFGLLVCFAAYTLAVGGAVLTRFATAEGWGQRPPPGSVLPAAPGAGPPPAAPPPPPGDEPWEPEIDPRRGEE